MIICWKMYNKILKQLPIDHLHFCLFTQTNVDKNIYEIYYIQFQKGGKKLRKSAFVNSNFLDSDNVN